MNRRNILRLFEITLSGVAVLNASANGFRLASQDAFATARGEAFVATADNPSAVYYNPAGVTQLDGHNFRAGIYGIYLDPTFTPPPPANTRTFHIEDKLAAVPQFFYTYTMKDLPWSFGLGVYSPFGLSAEWPQDTGFRAVATEGSLTYVTINPVVALKLAPNFSIGGGVTVNYANMELEQGLRINNTPANFFRITCDGWSVGYNLGLLWQPHDKVSLGASFRSATTVTLNGRTEAELLPWFHPPHQPAHMDYTFPLGAVFGVSYRPTPKWNLEFDADYTDWSSIGTLTIAQAAAARPVLPQNIHLTLNWQPSWMYEFGLTRYFDNGWHASAGYVFNENSVPGANYTPLVADLDRHFFSIGAGRKGKRLDFDIAYQFGYGPARTVTGSKPSTAGQIAGQTADGRYDFISHAVLVTVGVHF